MRFSVIIPVYNAEERIRRCLDSILMQSFSDYEVLLVNDGSTDGSKSICEEYADLNANVRYFEKENGGASSARNLGIRNAKGDYILFVDSDDYVDEAFFSTLKERCIPNGFAVFTFSWVRNNGISKRAVNDAMNGATLFEKVKYLTLSRTINAPVAKIFDAALLREIKLLFEESMPVAEDFNFCLKYAAHCSSINIYDESVYLYDMTNEASLVHKRKENMIDVYPIVFDYAFDTISSAPFSESEKKALLKIWDKLHTDSFITCVMEELKDKTLTRSEILKRIRTMCHKFNSRYKAEYGYENAVHFFVRFCIRFRLALVLYLASRAYSGLRS